MTENEAIKLINDIHSQCCDEANILCTTDADNRCIALELAIKALEEVQQYREIGPVEECRDVVQKHKLKKPIERISVYALAKNYDGDEAHRVYYDCPTCGKKGIDRDRACYRCGQLLDWSDCRSIVWKESGE